MDIQQNWNLNKEYAQEGHATVSNPPELHLNRQI